MPGAFSRNCPPLDTNDCRAIFAALRIEKYLGRFLDEEMEPADILLLSPPEQAALIPALGPRLRLFDFLLSECPLDPRVVRFRQLCAPPAPEPPKRTPSEPLSSVFSTPERREFALQPAESFFGLCPQNADRAYRPDCPPAPQRPPAPAPAAPAPPADTDRQLGDGSDGDGKPDRGSSPCARDAPNGRPSDDGRPPAEPRSAAERESGRAEKPQRSADGAAANAHSAASADGAAATAKRGKQNEPPAEFEGALIFYDQQRGFGFCTLAPLSGDGLGAPVDVYFNGSVLLGPECLVRDNARLTFNVRIVGGKFSGPFRDGHVVRRADLPLFKTLLAAVAESGKDPRGRTPLTAVNIRVKDAESSGERAFGVVDSVGSAYGFIASDSGEKVYFHKRNLPREYAEKIVKGERVSFFANRQKAESGEKGLAQVTASEVSPCRDKRPQRAWRKVETMTTSQKALSAKSGGEKAVAVKGGINI